MNVEKLTKLILENRRLDFSPFILRGSLGEPSKRSTRIPPVLIAHHQQYPPGTYGSAAELPLLDFEALSLAARMDLLELKEDDVLSDFKVADAKLKPCWFSAARRYQEQIKADAARSHSADHASLGTRVFEIDGRQLQEAIFRAAETISTHRAESSRRRHYKAEHRAHSSAGAGRYGLQIVGARIRGDIDLTGMTIPFSVRLIGCSLHGAMQLNHANLVTLDLSGTACFGIFATYLESRGSVRLRRMLSTSVVDFGGAHVRGVFDATDCVVIPDRDPPTPEAFVGDRGIFNLSLATIDNECRMSRVRIYGGVAMRGANINRSLILRDAIVRSPLGLLEKIAATRRSEIPNLPPSVEAHTWAEKELAKRIHPPSCGEDFKHRQEVEILTGFRITNSLRGQNGSQLLDRLAGEWASARIAAVRADGMTVNGNLFATGIRCGGLFRARYVKVHGGVFLESSRFRSAAAIKGGFAAIKQLRSLKAEPLHDQDSFDMLEKLWVDSGAAASQTEDADSDDVAIDLRGAHIDGSLLLRDQSQRGHETTDDGHIEDDKVEEKLREQLETFRRPVNEVVAGHEGTESGATDTGKNEHDLNPLRSFVRGRIFAPGAYIGEDFDLRGIAANFPRSIEQNKFPFLDITRTDIGGYLDFRRSVGIEGIKAELATIGSSLWFANELDDHQTESRNGDDQAVSLGGTVDLNGAKIGASATLIFKDGFGPSLALDRAEVGGALQILENKHTRPHETKREQLSTRRRPPTVSLQHAAATTFGHEPRAWPESNLLNIEGFIYQSVFLFGPLIPLPRTPQQTADDEKATGSGLWLALGAAVAVIAISRAFDDFFTLLLPGRSSLSAIGGILNFWILVVLAAIVVGHKSMKSLTAPSRKLMEPLALRWLERQEDRPNVFGGHGKPVKPLQPYLQAAKVLRSAGRWLSANRVELERLRKRRDLLPWRVDWPVKAFLVAADWIVELGFNPVRTLTTLIGAITLFAMTFQWADRCGYVHPSNDNIVAHAFEPEGWEEAYYNWSDPDSAGFASSAKTPYLRFSAIVFAVDLMVPFFDLGQETNWGINVEALKPVQDAMDPRAHINGAMKTGTTARLDSEFAFCPKSPFAWFSRLTILARLIGWLLAGILAIALLTRAEALVGRFED